MSKRASEGRERGAAVLRYLYSKPLGSGTSQKVEKVERESVCRIIIRFVLRNKG